MLARLKEVIETVPKPLPPTLVCVPRSKRRAKRIKVCRLYPKPLSERLVHARALLAFLQEHSPEAIGAYVRCCDLERFYREDLRALKGWRPYHWTAIARQLGMLTHKRMLRQNGRRFVGYQVPRP